MKAVAPVEDSFKSTVVTSCLSVYIRNVLDVEDPESVRKASDATFSFGFARPGVATSMYVFVDSYKILKSAPGVSGETFIKCPVLKLPKLASVTVISVESSENVVERPLINFVI